MKKLEVSPFPYPKPKKLNIGENHPFRVKNKVFAVIQPDGVSLVIKLTADDREAYTTIAPEVFSIPPTFSNMNYMIVRIDLVNDGELKCLIKKAWSIVAPKRLIKLFESSLNQ